MPSKVAVPYMNAWVMMLTLASRIGTQCALEVADQVVERPGLRGVVGGRCRRWRRTSRSACGWLPRMRSAEYISGSPPLSRTRRVSRTRR